MPYYLDAGEMYLAVKVEIMRECTILVSRLFQYEKVFLSD